MSITITDPVLEAARRVVARYGIRRSTMSDMAREAGVSRQTLYERYENKKGVLLAAMRYTSVLILERVEADRAGVDGLAAQLQVFFRHTTVDVFNLLRQHPDIADLFAPEDAAAQAVLKETEENKIRLLAGILLPYESALLRRQQSATSLARFIVTSCKGLKQGAASEEDLRQMLVTLEKLVLGMCETAA